MTSRTTTIRRAFHGLAALVVTLCFSSCAGIQNAINPAGPNAQNLSRLWWLMFIVCSIVYVLVIIAMFLSLRGRTKEAAERGPVLHLDTDSERRRQITVIVATAITVVILFVFLLASYSSGRALNLNDPTKNGLSIELTGHQWWWEARYDDVDASNIFTTANEIHIPVGVPVQFTLRSTDVNHSFWVPNLAGKKDLIPGKVTTMWLQADKPGVYRGQCAEYCGLQHAKMALWIVADPPEQFHAWRQNATQQAVQPASDLQKRGQQVFFSSTCVMCHAINGTPAGSNIGPNLTHVGSRNMIAAATLSNTRDHMTQWIKDSQTFKPGNKMPQNNLSDADLQALAEYLGSLK
jgi:cytochrome c oxidase subunit II